MEAWTGVMVANLKRLMVFMVDSRKGGDNWSHPFKFMREEGVACLLDENEECAGFQVKIAVRTGKVAVCRTSTKP